LISINKNTLIINFSVEMLGGKSAAKN